MTRFLSLSFLSVFLLVLVGCGDDDTPPPAADAGDDGGTDAGDDMGVDAGDDAGPLEMSTIYGPCVVDSQCPGEGAFCRQPADGYNMGNCTRECETRRQCDDGTSIGFCLDAPDHAGKACEDRCRNTVDCGRENYICADMDRIPGGRDGGRCIGICTGDADCGIGAECNEQSARCVATGTSPTEGASSNEACDSDNACLSGDCTLPLIDGTPTGELGGSCSSACAIPVGFQNSNFYLGDTLPAGHCPNAEDLCIPLGDTSAGSLGQCFAACTMDSLCREGRVCLRTIAGHRFTNGLCIPGDCLDGYACPDGTTCRPVSAGGRRAGRCAPN